MIFHHDNVHLLSSYLFIHAFGMGIFVLWLHSSNPHGFSRNKQLEHGKPSTKRRKSWARQNYVCMISILIAQFAGLLYGGWIVHCAKREYIFNPLETLGLLDDPPSEATINMNTIKKNYRKRALMYQIDWPVDSLNNYCPPGYPHELVKSKENCQGFTRKVMLSYEALQCLLIEKPEEDGLCQDRHYAWTNCNQSPFYTGTMVLPPEAKERKALLIRNAADLCLQATIRLEDDSPPHYAPPELSRDGWVCGCLFFLGAMLLPFYFYFIQQIESLA